MPIYEFYCRECHTVFSFFSSRINTEAAPTCPSCGATELSRKPSTFATLSSRSTEDEMGAEEAMLAGLDESRIEGAMAAMMTEMEGVDEEDPRQLGKLMRRFTELSGLEMGERMEAAMERIEAGEDPESVENELGIDNEELGGLFKLRKTVSKRSRPPQVDEQLYFL